MGRSFREQLADVERIEVDNLPPHASAISISGELIAAFEKKEGSFRD